MLLLFGLSKLDNITSIHRYLQNGETPQAAGVRVMLVGEVLWDRFPDSARLGGAPLNVAVHLKRLRHNPLLVSAVGLERAFGGRTDEPTAPVSRAWREVRVRIVPPAIDALHGTFVG